jgi:hypothetical protein
MSTYAARRCRRADPPASRGPALPLLVCAAAFALACTALGLAPCSRPPARPTPPRQPIALTPEQRMGWRWRVLLMSSGKG